MNTSRILKLHNRFFSRMLTLGVGLLLVLQAAGCGGAPAPGATQTGIPTQAPAAKATTVSTQAPAATATPAPTEAPQPTVTTVVTPDVLVPIDADPTVDPGLCNSEKMQSYLGSFKYPTPRPGYEKSAFAPSSDRPMKSGAFLCDQGVAIDKQIILWGQNLSKFDSTADGLAVKSVILTANPENRLQPNIDVTLFTITDGSSVADKAAKINGNHVRGSVVVTATPNYEIATRGNPSIGASPSGPRGRPMLANDFTNQWAFKVISQSVAQRFGDGSGVEVGIFDTVCPEDATRERVDITRVDQLANMPTVQELDEKTRTEDICGHGEFALSLSQAVAPNANYHLYRVMDIYGLGDVATLITGLQQFKALAAGKSKYSTSSQPLQGVVINLSLAINMPQSNPDTMGLLQQVLQNATDLGAVIVAAAGNDSTPQRIQPMQLPAAYPNVIGVGAVDNQIQRASYSDWISPTIGDVGAPGGDGNCNTVNAANDCVIGVYTPASQGVPAQYIAWRGTSFAAPFVTGLAALVIQRNADQQLPLSPADVRVRILSGVNYYQGSIAGNANKGFGDGLIDIAASLQ